MNRPKIDIFQIFQNWGELFTMKVYQATETQVDPFEKNTEKTFLNPIPIKCLIRDYSFGALQWKLEGLHEVGAKEVLCETRYKTLLEKCHKITIDDNEYGVYQDGNSKRFQIIERKDYLVILLDRK